MIAYLHDDLEVLTNSVELLAPGGRLVWIGHAPGSPHGPPPTVIRESLADLRQQLDVLAESSCNVLRLEEYELNPEFLDTIAVLEKPVEPGDSDN